MSKIGVGVGEDFPVDDGDGNKGAQGAQAGGDDRAEFEAWKRRRDDERRYYEDKRRRHDEWHQRKQEFKDRIKAAARDFGDDARDHHWHDDHRDWNGRHWHMSRFWPMGIGIALLAIAIPVLILAFFFSIISAAFKAPFVILAIVAIGAVIFMARHRHHHYGYSHAGHHGRGRYRYYSDDDIQTPPRAAQSQQPKQNGTPPIITPPPPATGA